MIFCPMRILPCEPGMHACDQPLHAWFHVEQKEHEDRPPPSLFDFEGSDGKALLLSDERCNITVLSRLETAYSAVAVRVL
jgi:hypothetical protein